MTGNGSNANTWTAKLGIVTRVKLTASHHNTPPQDGHTSWGTCAEDREQC